MEQQALFDDSSPQVYAKSGQERLQELLERRARYEALEKALISLPRKLDHRALVPFGPKLFIPGNVVRTNELLVLLGESQFVEKSAFETREMVHRRLKIIDDNIKKVTIGRNEMILEENDPLGSKELERSRRIKQNHKDHLGNQYDKATLSGSISTERTTRTDLKNKMDRSQAEKQKLVDAVLRSSLLADEIAKETGVVSFYEVHDNSDDEEPSRVVFPPSWRKDNDNEKELLEDVTEYKKEKSAKERSIKRVSFSPEVDAAEKTQEAKLQIDRAHTLEGEPQTQEQAIEQLRALELEEEATEQADVDSESVSQKSRKETGFLSGFRKGFLEKKKKSKHRVEVHQFNAEHQKQLDEGVNARNNGTQRTSQEKIIENFNVVERVPPGKVKERKIISERQGNQPLEPGAQPRPLSRFKQQRLARLQAKQK